MILSNSMMATNHAIKSVSCNTFSNLEIRRDAVTTLVEQ